MYILFGGSPLPAWLTKIIEHVCECHERRGEIICMFTRYLLVFVTGVFMGYCLGQLHP